MAKAPDNFNTVGAILRYARLYSDGSFNVASESEDQVAAVAKISGSTDDDDTQLVQVEIRVVASLGYPKMKVVEADPTAAELERLRAAFRVNMLRLSPGTTHDEIDTILEAVKHAR